MSIHLVSIVVASALLLVSAAAGQIERTTVWASGADGYHTYRIPAAIVTTGGSLLAFCEGREARGDSGRIHLLVKRSEDGGKSFSAQEIVWADGDNTCGNPCPVVDRSTGVIWLLMTHNHGQDSESEMVAGKGLGRRTVWVSRSKDDGKTWEPPREITNDVSKPDWMWYATGPGVGIQIQQGKHTGRMVIPCDYTRRGGGKEAGNSHVIYSDDHGKSWKLGGEAPEKGFNESQVVELSDGRLMLNMRNARPPTVPQRGVCISDDGGETFRELRHDPVLVEPVCQASIIAYSPPLAEGHPPAASRGPNVLFSNPAHESKRINMTVRLSRDDGATWAESKVIHPGPSAYSCLVALPDGQIGLLYECGQKTPYERIEFARFSMP